MSLHRSVKHGIGRLTASAEGTGRVALKTRLTQVSHKAPTRLLPLRKSSVDQAGAAICALSNYGGGMLQGDSCSLEVSVKPNAKLGIMTQGASRIYTQRQRNDCEATMDATVHQGGLLVLAPDPCSLFENSSFLQNQHFQIHKDSSVALIDWFSSGRYRNGEHWAFDKLVSRTSLSWLDDDDGDTNDENATTRVPFLQDSVSMDLTSMNRNEDDPLGVSNFHAFASLLLYGDEVQTVQERCIALQDELVSRYTRIRERPMTENEPLDTAVEVKQLGLAGRICMGVSRVPLVSTSDDSSMSAGKDNDAYVVRLAATTNEDLYRIFHHCLYPLHDRFGVEFYKERIRARASEIPRAHSPEDSSISVQVHSNSRNNIIVQDEDEEKKKNSSSDFDDSTFWSAYMLADSNLPTGSFAHSAGLETAAQLGMFHELDDGNDGSSVEEKVQIFIQAATRSSMQVVTPFMISGHRIATNLKQQQQQDDSGSISLDDLCQQWRQLHEQTRATMISNAPAHAASLDQGKSMVRVAQQWLKQEIDNNSSSNNNNGNNDPKKEAVSALLQCLKSESDCHHVGPVLGALSAVLGLNERQTCRLFGYCMARDMVSAAVRLSLVGPLASVPMLHGIQQASDDGWSTSLAAMTAIDSDSSNLSNPLLAAAASAPVIEALHPCHDILQVRLFRT